MPQWTKCPSVLTTTHSSGERVERKVSVPVILIGPKRRTALIAGLLPLGLRLVRVSRRLLLLNEVLLLLFLLLLLLLHILGCPCRRTPWLARGPSGLLLLQEILELALGHRILIVVLPVGVDLLVPVGHTSARPWAPGVLLDGAVLDGLVHGLDGRLGDDLARNEALLDGPCGRAATASWLPCRHVLVLACVGLAWLLICISGGSYQ